jgi:hypothetical protein
MEFWNLLLHPQELVMTGCWYWNSYFKSGDQCAIIGIDPAAPLFNDFFAFLVRLDFFMTSAPLT